MLPSIAPCLLPLPPVRCRAHRATKASEQIAGLLIQVSRSSEPRIYRHRTRQELGSMKRLDGRLKDKMSTWRARAARNGARARLQVAIVGATSHEEEGRLMLQNEALNAMEEVLMEESAGGKRSGPRSRLHAAECLRLLAQRLQKTESWAVAIKCLLLLHKALVAHGFFDPLLVAHPDDGLLFHIPNLTHFKDSSNAHSLEASFWIRWYATFLHALVQASIALGDGTARFRPSSKPPPPPADPSHRLLPNILALQSFLHHICACPLQSASSHLLITESFKLVALDSLVAQDELRLHLREFCKRQQPYYSGASLALSSPSSSDEAPDVATRLRSAGEELVADAPILAHIMREARAMKLVFSHPDPDGAMLTDRERLEFRDAVSAMSTTSTPDLVLSGNSGSRTGALLMLPAPPKV